MKRMIKKEEKGERDSYANWQKSHGMAIDHSLGGDPQGRCNKHFSHLWATQSIGAKLAKLIVSPLKGFVTFVDSLPRVSLKLHPGLLSYIPSGLFKVASTPELEVTNCDLKMQLVSDNPTTHYQLILFNEYV